METYQEFLNRINSFELPDLYIGDGNFTPNPSVWKKVQEDSSFAPFYGDTVVFDLTDNEKSAVNTLVNVLYETAPETFAERLIDTTFHMTLHDLSNSPILEEVTAPMQENETTLRKLLAEKPVSVENIRMKSKAIFNMVNTSIVLGLYPENEAEYLKLMELYNLINGVKELAYSLTPHITLAYFNRNGIAPETAEKLAQEVKHLNETTLTFELNTSRLNYQHFTNMNSYQPIFSLPEI